jgi:hypothetical protein
MGTAVGQAEAHYDGKVGRSQYARARRGLMIGSMECHKIWIEPCAATEDIREQFGSKSALDYLVGEKLFTFLAAAEQDQAFAAELPAFVAEVRRLFTAQELREYLDQLARKKYFAETAPELDDLHDLDDETMEKPWPDNPVVGAQELLRFFRVRELLQQ